jgi:hypothetical protein
MLNYIKEYREHPAINYSLLSKMLSSPRNLLKDSTPLTEPMIKGSLVDCLAFTPEEFSSQFYIPTINKPSGKMGIVLDKYMEFKAEEAELNEAADILDDTNLILKARVAAEYNAAMTEATFLKKFKEDCEPYFLDFERANDRIVVSEDLYNAAVAIVINLQTNEFTAKYFNKALLEKGWELQYQVPMFGKLDHMLDPTKTSEVKALFDGILFDHNRKIIYPFDLKVTGRDNKSFENLWLYDHYYIQSGLYSSILQQNYPDYVIAGFRFIVASEYQAPLIWIVDEAHLMLALTGGTLRNGYELIGVRELLDNLVWHRTEEKYQYSAEVYRNEGECRINLMD